MKQIIIGKKKAYAASTAKYTDLTTVPDGTIGIYSLKDGSLISTAAKFVGPVAVVCGRGSDKMPILFPELNADNCTVAKASYAAGATFSGKITVPTPVVGKNYTVIITKIGTVFNERNNWSFTHRATDTTAANVAAELVKRINMNSENLGVTAANTGGAITITAKKMGDNYNIVGADELTGASITNKTTGKKAVLDKDYVIDLASRCAAGKGFNDVYRDGDTIYPGYPEPVDEEQYVEYTLRFSVPRVSAKTRDEVVSQLLHIVVPVGSGCITTLDIIFGFSSPSSDSQGD